ncbi:MAG: site-specific integrase [Candidatus Afipia apatlaquensis]|uniref:Site-specific integrase n=1 Tax=Candidatus Afipia apatlaquensis TaxID=2712852 RepID=A0A7C9VEG3_9BRAD|nr:site-specific integrase [Candidatus Afipia apatlaquensis]
MTLGKQAKPLSKGQIEAVLGYLTKTRHPIRNRLIFLLSIKAGLRAREIALLTWRMVTDAQGEIGHAIVLQDDASKGRSGRVIPLNEELHRSLIDWQQFMSMVPDRRVIRTERSKQTSPQVIVNMFARWYEQIGFDGCSSHSGRRTFITNAARKISLVGGSLRDVQMLAGHSSLRVTQRYIDGEQDAQRKIVELV